MGPTIAPEHGFPTALESGIAVVALGLIIASRSAATSPSS
jgi:hypothetical protein